MCADVAKRHRAASCFPHDRNKKGGDDLAVIDGDAEDGGEGGEGNGDEVKKEYLRAQER